ncbi:hypothetical protein J4233_04005 [Candidatus Pacearchaeota archaeon]|nr:hypothetical protein [Candidatus Pacearchaeota archaeon]
MAQQVAKYRIQAASDQERQKLNDKLGSRLLTVANIVAVTDAYNSIRSESSRVFHFQDTTLNHYGSRADYQLEVFGTDAARDAATKTIAEVAEPKLVFEEVR